MRKIFIDLSTPRIFSTLGIKETRNFLYSISVVARPRSNNVLKYGLSDCLGRRCDSGAPFSQCKKYGCHRLKEGEVIDLLTIFEASRLIWDFYSIINDTEFPAWDKIVAPLKDAMPELYTMFTQERSS